MKKAEQAVFVIDDDPSMRTAIRELIEAVGLSRQTFGSGQELLEAKLPDVPSCLVLDVRHPGLSGLNLQRPTLPSKDIVPYPSLSQIKLWFPLADSSRVKKL